MVATTANGSPITSTRVRSSHSTGEASAAGAASEGMATGSATTGSSSTARWILGCHRAPARVVVTWA